MLNISGEPGALAAFAKALTAKPMPPLPTINRQDACDTYRNLAAQHEAIAAWLEVSSIAASRKPDHYLAKAYNAKASAHRAAARAAHAAATGELTASHRSQVN